MADGFQLTEDLSYHYIMLLINVLIITVMYKTKGQIELRWSRYQFEVPWNQHHRETALIFTHFHKKEKGKMLQRNRGKEKEKIFSHVLRQTSYEETIPT